jgi:SAM-dependent methyltransferase
MKFIAIDDEGFPHFHGIRVTDQDIGRAIIKNLKPSSKNSGTQVELDGVTATVESFDYPWVIQSVTKILSDEEKIEIELPYQVQMPILLKDLRVDQWDRFVGLDSHQNIPFVFSRKAQAQFFEMCEEFDDDSVTIKGKRFTILPQYFTAVPTNQSEFWNEKYQSNQRPGWELETHHPSLPHIIAQLKLSKSRILILGCGSGNDAAYFASFGHIVTAVDFSPLAIQKAKSKYGHLPNITWIEGDIFDPKLPVSNGSFDMVFEHTCFCAIEPSRRDELVQLWIKKLHDQGHLLGIFFTMWKTEHPPFGSTEWEIKQHTSKKFAPLYWQRLKPPLALESRLGMELLVYARVTRS